MQRRDDVGAQHPHRRGEQRDVDHGPGPGALTPEQRRGHAEREVHGAVAVAERAALGDRLAEALGSQSLAQPPASPERGGVISRPARVRAAYPETVTAGVDEARVDLAKLVGPETEALQHRRQVIGEEHIRPGHEPQHDLATRGGLEIERDTALSPVGELHRRVDPYAADALRDQAAVAVPGTGRLDLDHIRSPVGQQRTSDRHEHPLSQLHDPHPAEQVRGLAVRHRGPGPPAGSAGVNRYSRSALPRRILYCVSGGRPCTSFFATPMESGQVVSVCG